MFVLPPAVLVMWTERDASEVAVEITRRVEVTGNVSMLNVVLIEGSFKVQYSSTSPNKVKPLALGIDATFHCHHSHYNNRISAAPSATSAADTAIVALLIVVVLLGLLDSRHPKSKVFHHFFKVAHSQTARALLS